MREGVKRVTKLKKSDLDIHRKKDTKEERAERKKRADIENRRE